MNVIKTSRRQPFNSLPTTLFRLVTTTTNTIPNQPNLNRELKLRNLINQQTYYLPSNGTSKLKLPFVEKLTSNLPLNTGSQTNPKFSVYLGIDPTSTSLHLGHLLPITTLLRFLQYGYPIIFLLGGATGSIGDPSGRNLERNLLERNTVQLNLEQIQTQLEKLVLNFYRLVQVEQVKGQVKVLNNQNWLNQFSFLQFLNQVGRHFKVNSMLRRDSVKSRLDSNSGISFTEFSYQLLQAYDFFHLYKSFNCRLQVGGNDQWGNILSGMELIHKLEKTHVDGLTTPLMTDSHGNKLSKSTDGVLYLNPSLTSPLQFYQYLLKVDDAVVKRRLMQLSFYSIQQIELWELEAKGQEEYRLRQAKLAEFLTRLVHGEEGFQQAQLLTQFFFPNPTETNNPLQLHQLETTFPVDHQLTTQLQLQRYLNQPILNLIVDIQLVRSKGEGKRLIQNQGLYLNTKKVQGINQVLTQQDLIANWGVIFKVGKSKFKVVKLV